MKAIMNLKELKNTQALQTILDGVQAIVFSVPGEIKQPGMILSSRH